MSETKGDGERTRHRDVTINIRARKIQRDLIDEASELIGTSRSDFMLSAACREAEKVLLEKRVFYLSVEDLERFSQVLDAQPLNNSKLKELMETEDLWTS